MKVADMERMRTIRPETHSSVDPGPRDSKYGKYSAGIEALADAGKIFDVTPYRLSFLLGTAHPQKIYQCLRCESKPSVKYMLRLVKLHQLQITGLQLITVRSVNWDTGVIRYHPIWNGVKFVESTSLLPGGVQRDILAEWKSKTPSWA